MIPSVLVLGGPTAAGKTAASLEVAERWGAVVLSADAMQVYRGMDVGTAKASAEERARVPHFGLDLREPDEPFDAGDFVELADQLLAEGRRLVVAGGTSFYLSALIRGLVRTPPVDQALRAELEALADPWSALQAVDPALAARLHPNDRVRIVRGLEVFQSGGVRLSELQAAHAAAPDRVRAVGLWLDRDDLDARIDARVEQMMAQGYLDEVRALMARGYGPSHKPMQSLGYRHLCAHLLGALPLDAALALTRRDTRRFARKQRTWLRGLGFPRVLPDHLPAALAAGAHAFG
ncbi:MAG: tRNA (adenosine(37)-N6)-dimethylallyltransferase MiaA [Deltaproteobacteria bacterium]|nr:tRNA (adenosine(37)-N6)-dimethylallyltransferase MiaA [Deltaproteobacteria bacterium]